MIARRNNSIIPCFVLSFLNTTNEWSKRIPQMNKNFKDTKTDIYDRIRETVDLQEYCENALGMSFTRKGKSYRANSPFGTDAGGSFSIDINAPEFWLDFAATDDSNATKYRQGDVIEVCALLNHDGDKKAALLELLEYLPENERKKYSAELTKLMRERQEEQERIAHAHELLTSGELKLTSHWPAYLHSRGIDDEQISRLKLGVDMTNSGMLLLPRFNFDGVEVLGHNRRRMPNSHGIENEAEAKYMYAFCNSFIKKVPAGLQTLNREGKFLVLTEGDFDVMNFEREGFAVLGALSGKDWQIVLSNAENFDCVVLAYDNDDKGREYTLTAAHILLEHRISFCVVDLPAGFKDINNYYCAHIATHDTCLQELIDNAIDGLEFTAKSFMPEGGFERLKRREQAELKNKLKDFLIQAVRSGLDQADITILCDSLSKCYPSNWLAEIVKLAAKGETEFTAVENLLKKHELRYNARTGFYRYDSSKGIWVLLDDAFIGALVREYLGYSASAKKIRNITEHLKAAASSIEPIEKFNRLQLFAFRNGTLRYSKDSATEDFFGPASPADCVTHRVSYDYDPDAEAPTWLKAVDTIFAGDKKRIDAFQEFCGYALLHHCRYQKALILRDKSTLGSNGKSTILEVLRAVFGQENCTSLEPVEFEDIHAVVQLKDARLNICTDTRAESKVGDSNLKKAITGDTLRGRLLHRDFIEFAPTAKIIFAVNHFNTAILSGSMKRRLLLIDCPVRFVDDPQEGNAYEVKADNSMKKKLMKELSGIFNWVMTGALRLVRNGGKFTLTDEQAELDNAPTDSARNDSSVEDFVSSDFIVQTGDVDGNGRTYTRSEIYAQYLLYCEAEGIEEPISNRGKCGRGFHELFRQALNANNISFRERKNSEGIFCYDFS